MLVHHVPNAAADGEWDEDVLGGLGEHLQHRLVGERRVSVSGDVEKCDLVNALLVVPTGERHRLSQIAHIAAILCLFPHVILIAFRDDQISRVVCADVEGGDDPLAVARRSFSARGQWRRRRRRGAEGVAQEAAQDREARSARLLRVELNGGNVATGHAAHERFAVLGLTQCPARELWA